MPNPSVSIDYLREEKAIEILDSKNLILGNRRAKFQLEQQFKVVSISPPAIRLNVESERETSLVQKLIELFAFLNIESVLESSAKAVVESYLTEKESFKRFSKKASEIWHANVDVPILEEFTHVLEENWPKRSLYKRQLLASFHLAFSQNACNFSVPGSGKTSTVLGAFTYLSSLQADDAKYVNKILVVGPLSCFQPWESEFEACFGYAPNSFRISGELNSDQIEAVLYSLSKHNLEKELFLVSYQSLANYLDGLKSLLSRKGHRFMVVLDEAHRAKNTEGGLWARSVLSLAPYAKSRVVLTGTPAPNGYQDLYNLFEFIWPGKNVIGYTPRHLRVMTERAYDTRRTDVADNIAPFFVRISKTDLKIPPAVNNRPMFVEMGAVQRSIYDYIENVYLDYFRDESRNPKSLLVRSRLIRLMQAASNPALLTKPITDSMGSEFDDALFIDDARIFELIKNYKNLEIPTKFVRILERVKELVAAGQKVLIWCYYIENILSLREYLAQHSIDCRLLYGAVPLSSTNSLDVTRESIIEDFHKFDSDFKVIIANPYAVGESISLHRACQNAIYFERNFNAAVYLQSKDRIHRFGMPKSKTAVYDYVRSTDSVEETITRRLNQKIEAMMEVVESREIPLLNLTRDSVDSDEDDINSIITDYLSRKGNIDVQY